MEMESGECVVGSGMPGSQLSTPRIIFLLPMHNVIGLHYVVKNVSRKKSAIKSVYVTPLKTEPSLQSQYQLAQHSSLFSQDGSTASCSLLCTQNSLFTRKSSKRDSFIRRYGSLLGSSDDIPLTGNNRYSGVSNSTFLR